MVARRSVRREEGDEDRLFYKMAWWKKVIVMAGGPTVNLLIAFFLFWTVFGTYGARTIEPNPGPPVIETVSECLLPYAEEGRACRADDPPTPARPTAPPPATRGGCEPRR